MKILFDQNISFRVVKKISALYPDVKQVRELGLENKSDRQIWQYAKENSYTIASFDADFYELSTLYGSPPKVIWLRIGNTSRQSLEAVFENLYLSIKSFIDDESNKDISCLEIV